MIRGVGESMVASADTLVVKMGREEGEEIKEVHYCQPGRPPSNNFLAQSLRKMSEMA